jgi:flagellar secretion chaperone FliS
MLPAHIANYQSVQIRTSSPGEILLALYDGLFKFLQLAKHSIRARNAARAGEAISRAHAILSELYGSLDHSQYPELCKNLSSLYEYCLRRLMHANRHRDVAALDEVMLVLTPVREANREVVKKLAAMGSQEARPAGAR